MLEFIIKKKEDKQVWNVKTKDDMMYNSGLNTAIAIIHNERYKQKKEGE